jgi:hypothetical protein
MGPAPVWIPRLSPNIHVRIRTGIGIYTARDTDKSITFPPSQLTDDWALHESHHVLTGPSTDEPRQQANLVSPPDQACSLGLNTALLSRERER